MPELDEQYRLLRRRSEPAARTYEAYRAAGGYQALERALKSMSSQDVINDISEAGLRGRGGAGVQTAQKWQFVASEESDQKYIICNAYDADPQSRISRTLLEQTPHMILEGMAIAAYATGAQEGYLFTRSTQVEAIASAQEALREALEQGAIGRNIFETEFTFAITVVGVDVGFIGGEESTLIEIIKGKRAMPQQRPPYPAKYGLWEKPTVVDSIETLANVPYIIKFGPNHYKQIGSQETSGTKILTVWAPELENKPRVVEVPFGTTIRQTLRHAFVAQNERAVRAVVVGGPEGGALPTSVLDTPIDFESIESIGAIIGSGTIEVLPTETCMANWALQSSRYLSNESCGKCVPCRLGVKRIAGTLEGIVSGLGEEKDIALLEEFTEYVPNGSLCGFGVHAPNPVKSVLKYFNEDIKLHISEQQCPTQTCVPVRVHRFVTKGVL